MPFTQLHEEVFHMLCEHINWIESGAVLLHNSCEVRMNDTLPGFNPLLSELKKKDMYKCIILLSFMSL